jgi:hypothetical protein
LATEAASTLMIEGVMAGELQHGIVFAARPRSERFIRSTGALNLSVEGEGSVDVTGVGGVE